MYQIMAKNTLYTIIDTTDDIGIARSYWHDGHNVWNTTDRQWFTINYNKVHDGHSKQWFTKVTG